jgi:hypothetical protein
VTTKKRTIDAVDRTAEFKRDIKKLSKRFGTIQEDLQHFIDYGVTPHHCLDQPDPWIVRMSGLGFADPPVFIAKRVTCQSLRGTGSQSGLRVVYAWFADEGRIELVELFYKGDKKSADFDRIRRLYGRGGGSAK